MASGMPIHAASDAATQALASPARSQASQASSRSAPTGDVGPELGDGGVEEPELAGPVGAVGQAPDLAEGSGCRGVAGDLQPGRHLFAGEPFDGQLGASGVGRRERAPGGGGEPGVSGADEPGGVGLEGLALVVVEAGGEPAGVRGQHRGHRARSVGVGLVGEPGGELEQRQPEAATRPGDRLERDVVEVGTAGGRHVDRLRPACPSSAGEGCQLGFGDEQAPERRDAGVDGGGSRGVPGEPVGRVARRHLDPAVADRQPVEGGARCRGAGEVSRAQQLHGEGVGDDAVAGPAGDRVGVGATLCGPAGAGDARSDVGEGVLEVDAGVRNAAHVSGDLAEQLEAGQHRRCVAAGPARGEGEVGRTPEGERRRADAVVEVAVHEVAPGPRRQRAVERGRGVADRHPVGRSQESQGHGLVGSGVAEHPVGGDLEPLQREARIGASRVGEQAQHGGVGGAVEPVDLAAGLEQLERGVVHPVAFEGRRDEVGHGLEGVVTGVEAADPEERPVG